MNTEQGNDEMR